MTAGWKRRAAGAAMALLLLAAVRENGGNAGQDAVRPGGDPAPVRAFTMGPSSVQLPYADDYGPYQWALQNTGTLKLIPGSRPAFRPGSDGADAAGTDGPDRESRESVRSVAGIDLNLIPAWKQYDAVSEKREVVVALIDTGVDAGHPDLAGSLWVNVDEIPGDGIDNDGNGYVDDVNGWNFYDGSGHIFTGASDTHGTHSAGTIAAAPNGSGTIGICYPAYVKIMVLKILGGSQGVGTTEHVTEAIRYAQENGASICNLSFGTPQYSRELYEAGIPVCCLWWRPGTGTARDRAMTSTRRRCIRPASIWKISSLSPACSWTGRWIRPPILAERAWIWRRLEAISSAPFRAADTAI